MWDGTLISIHINSINCKKLEDMNAVKEFSMLLDVSCHPTETL